MQLTQFLSRRRAQKAESRSPLFSFLYSRKIAPYLFVSPFILSVLVLYLYPFYSAIQMSFQRVLPGQVFYVGLENYERVMNPIFFRALQNTSIYVVLTVILLTVLPLMLALILNHRLTRWSNFFRAAIFIPALTSVVVAGTIFRLIFGESDQALANQVLSFIGFSPLDWRYEAWTAMFLMVAMATWRWLGVNVIYFLAALQTVNNDLTEAASMDGANALQRFRHVTLPAIKPIIVFLVTITIINGFRMFEESYVLWESSSPGYIGLTVVRYIYREGIQNNALGFGAAVGIILLAIIFVVSMIQLYLTGAFKKEH
ncbi:sugar ABC transporter permease [Natronospirillum operosum]|uniref:Sugar ABC transporter permease n=1 Tax=Natronospirillum operosum TaxID=2759953 RepID=A0A4Z0WEW2_9GAMM|nr:sugar ABC transporter permease [Natronospirillum operosum]TGG93481.1 sugar ABC transporter permease [Natronospirillum operosum]